MKLAKLTEKIEAIGWNVETKGNYTLIENWSPAGENLCLEVFTESGEDMVDAIREHIRREYLDYDIDEHVDLWAESRGKRGVPSSYAVLVHDAEAIEEMLEKLWEAVA